MNSKKVIKVVALGSAADALGWSESAIELIGDARLADLIAELETRSDRLVAARGSIRYAVNHQSAPPAAPLSDGDEVAIIPPVSGG